MILGDLRRSHALLIAVVFALIFYILFLTQESYTLKNGKVKQEQSARLPGGADLDDVFLIPNVEEMQQMNKDQLVDMYWRYINTLQTLCRNVFRFGSFNDGGKEICLDSEFKPKRSCLVYSFGSNFQFDFEEAVIRQFGCEVHTFDPTMKVDPLTWKAPDYIVFHKVGLAGDNNVTQQKWQMKTLGTIMGELKHENKNKGWNQNQVSRYVVPGLGFSLIADSKKYWKISLLDRINSTIDILKIDTEGAEWKALPEALRTGSLQRAKQIALEVHFTPNLAEMIPQLKVLRDLYDGGFRIFMRERNLGTIQTLQSKQNTKYTTVNEISLINTRFKEPRRHNDDH